MDATKWKELMECAFEKHLFELGPPSLEEQKRKISKKKWKQKIHKLTSI